VPPRREWTESIREPAVPLQGLWSLWGPGTQGAVPGGAEGADGVAYGGSAWGGRPRRHGVSRGRSGSRLFSPRVAGTLGRAKGGDVLGVSGGGRTGRSGCRRTRPVVACVGSHRSEAGSLSGRPMADPPLRGQAVGPAGSY